MPKLPANYVKAPSFDNPLRSTTEQTALTDRRLVVRLNETMSDALRASSEREGITAEAIVERAVERYLMEPGRVVFAPRIAEAPKQSLREMVVGQFHERLVRRRGVQFLLSLREMLRSSGT